MTVFVHSIVTICFKFLFVDRSSPTATLKEVSSFYLEREGEVLKTGQISGLWQNQYCERGRWRACSL